MPGGSHGGVSIIAGGTGVACGGLKSRELEGG